MKRRGTFDLWIYLAFAIVTIVICVEAAMKP